ncbi:MAG: cation-translocating P-type ATPase [Dysgonamonadaceae bacterium]|nr:cation-translocating P-type ATPase [Dysgonamonadaceae bacterium]
MMKLPFHDRKFLYLLAAVALAITLEILSLGGIRLPLPYAPFVYGLFILGAGYEVLWSGLQSLLKLRFGSINLLMLIAVTAAFYLKEYPEATVVIVLYVLGEKLEDIGIENSRSALDKLVSNAPKTALVKATGEHIPIGEVKTGTVIQVKPHDQIPLDGQVEKGETSVDESSITGEPVPAFKVKGDPVFAGTLNKNGFIEVKTTKEHKDSTFSKIIELTYQSQGNKSDSQKFIEKFAQVYTPLIILSAVCLLVVPVFIFQQDFQHWLRQAITLLVISCPCALVISTPVAIYAALGNASSRGALVKGGKFLEAMAEIKAIALDKTRTITYGHPVVSDVVPLNENDREELLGCGAGTELFSEHPLAQAIVDASKREGVEPHEANFFESVVGEGAKARCMVCNNEMVLVGKIGFIEKYQRVDEATKEVVNRFASQGKTSVIVSCKEDIKGVIGLTDEIKPSSARAIRELQSQGIETVMITGDSQQAAQYVAGQVNIRQLFGGLLPQDKAQKINELKSEYRFVAMVGDGVNDAPALASSTVGIAMGAAGSDTAIEIADIALMNDNLLLLPFLIRLAKKTVKTIQWNTFGAIAVKVIFILLAFFGFGNLVLAITADVGVTLIVILISLRLMNAEAPAAPGDTH